MTDRLVKTIKVLLREPSPPKKTQNKTEKYNRNIWIIFSLLKPSESFLGLKAKIRYYAKIFQKFIKLLKKIEELI